MQRDTRRGREHWTGCHSFENIICDGNLSTAGSTRDGGLKMGGTYWYYVSHLPLCERRGLQLINFCFAVSARRLNRIPQLGRTINDFLSLAARSAGQRPSRPFPSFQWEVQER